jgi:hypothetical protein
MEESDGKISFEASILNIVPHPQAALALPFSKGKTQYHFTAQFPFLNLTFSILH